MKAFLMDAYEFLSVLLPFLLVSLLLRKKHKLGRGITAVPHGWTMLSLIYLVYIAAVFSLTGAGTLFDIHSYGVSLRPGQMNLVPFSQTIDPIGYLQNVLLFLPLGFLLPILWPDTDRFWYAALAGISFSLLIELSQLCNHRRTDVDDLILNTAGALLGFLLYRGFVRVTKWRGLPYGASRWEPVLYTGAMFAGHFLLFYELGIARLLYHF